MSERAAIIEFLRSDLYERIGADATGIEFANPGFRVRIMGHRNDPTIEVWRVKSGDYFGRLENATVESVSVFR